MDIWAPTVVMHVVRALTATGLQFLGPHVLHQWVHSQALHVDGQTYTLVRRLQTPIEAAGPAAGSINWKVKYTLPVVYPSSQGDSVQFAWELQEDTQHEFSGNLFQDVVSRNLLSYRIWKNISMKKEQGWSTISSKPKKMCLLFKTFALFLKKAVF